MPWPRLIQSRSPPTGARDMERRRPVSRIGAFLVCEWLRRRASGPLSKVDVAHDIGAECPIGDDERDRAGGDPIRRVRRGE